MTETIPLTVTVDCSAEKQTFLGWGTSLCWWAHILGQWKNQCAADDVCRLLFSPDKGLGINTVRYNIGAGEDPPNKIRLRYGADIPCYLPSDGCWNPDADKGQRYILSKAVELGSDTIELFLNSPPLWMTQSASTAGSENGLCNLKEDHYNMLADFLVSVTDLFQNHFHIPIDTLAPFNEPLSFWWKSNNNQEGCHFDISQQSKLIKLIATKLNDKNLDTKISAPECWSTYETIYTCNHYDSSVMDLIGQINTHSYFSDAQSRKELSRIASVANKALWMSEISCGGNQPHSHNDMESALELAQNITLHLNEMNAVGWIYWQAVENEQLKHNHGLIHADFDGSEKYYLTKQYHVFAHYSRFIRPQDILLRSSCEENVIISKSQDHRRITVVAFNSSSVETCLQIKDILGNFAAVTQMFQTTVTYNFKEIPIVENGTISLPPESVTSILVE